MEKILIKTSHDLKNQNSKPKIILGNHCNTYDYNKKILYDFKIETTHYWDDYKVFTKDSKYLEELYAKLLKKLIKKLNEFHNCKKSDCFWEIILGPWLIYFCTNIFDRWKTITNISQQQNISTEINESLNKFQIPETNEEYRKILISETYNHYIYSKILLFLNKYEKSEISFFETKGIFLDDIQEILTTKTNKKLQTIRILKDFFINLTRVFTYNQKITILRTYLGKINNFKINLRLFQFPLIYHNSINSQKLYSNKKREDFIFKFNYQNNFEKFINEEIINHIPKIFIEKFDSLQKHILNSNLPKNPKIIFSTNIYNNTFLSFYTAIKKENGTKLILSQHGGCYGQYDNHWAENFEIKISDKFLSYGWINKTHRNKIIPFGFIKDINNDNQKNYKNNKKLLFIVRSRTKYINKLDSSARSNQSFDYLENSYKFLHNLDYRLKKNTLIRLRDIDLGWAEHPRFSKEFPNFKFDFGISNIFELMKSSRIVVSTSLSTSYLESLAMNIPSLVISNYHLEPMRDQAKKYLQLLIDAKILHFSSISAAKHINNVWGNIDQWWASKLVQDNINEFCNKYAKNICNKETELIKTIKSSINEK